MDSTIFKKLKAKPEMSALLINAPDIYPKSAELDWTAGENADFVHLFVESKEEFGNYFEEAVRAAKKDALVWLSYPKASGKQRYDINRDSLWDLLIPLGWHPVAQVSLDEKWSAIRLKQNEPGKTYARPV